MLLAAVNSTFYNVILLLHIAAAIVGFGGIALNGVYGSEARKRGGAAGLAIAEANEFASSRFAEMASYLVPVLGIVLIAASRKQYEFSQAWVSASFVFYILGVAVARTVIAPTQRHMIELMRELVEVPPGDTAGAVPPPQVAKLEAAGRRIAAAGGVNHLFLVVILYLMIFKPGL